MSELFDAAMTLRRLVQEHGGTGEGVTVHVPSGIMVSLVQDGLGPLMFRGPEDYREFVLAGVKFKADWQPNTYRHWKEEQAVWRGQEDF